MTLAGPTKVRVSITDQDGVLLDQIEYDLEKIERALKKHVVRNPALLARDIAFFGDEAGDIISQEIRAALHRRGMFK